MLSYSFSSLRFAVRRGLRMPQTLATLLLIGVSIQAVAQNQDTSTPVPPKAVQDTKPPAPPKVPQERTPVREPAPGKMHPAETNPGQTPHSSSAGPAIASSLGAVAAGVVIGELIAHHNNSPGHIGHDGPQVPKELDMSGFVIKGLARSNWPVVVDFLLDSPGIVQIDVISANKKHLQATMTNTPHRRAYAIIHLPPDFGSQLQTAFYQVRSTPPAGTSTASPGLRVYGLGAGDKAVGSVAIDELTFQPAIIHPKANEVATYGFHAHSAFDDVRAEFIFTTLYNGHVLVQQDQEEKLRPIPEGERAKGTWEGKGKPGEHLLQVRAWRGIENGGDWVVAWSPDIVEVIK